MTERGTRARWTAAALVAPAAAAVFTGTTVWAAENQPVTTKAASPAAAAPVAPTVDPALAQLRADVWRARTQVASLTRQVTALRKQAAALASGSRSGSAGTASRSGSGSSSSTTTTTRSTNASTPAAKPAPKPVAPPASNTTTGASG